MQSYVQSTWSIFPYIHEYVPDLHGQCSHTFLSNLLEYSQIPLDWCEVYYEVKS